MFLHLSNAHIPGAYGDTNSIACRQWTWMCLASMHAHVCWLSPLHTLSDQMFLYTSANALLHPVTLIAGGDDEYNRYHHGDWYNGHGSSSSAAAAAAAASDGDSAVAAAAAASSSGDSPCLLCTVHTCLYQLLMLAQSACAM